MSTNQSDKPIRYTADPHYIHRQTAGEHLLIPVGDAVSRFNGFIELNQSAALLWDALKTARTKKELASLLIDTFGLSERQADADADAFLSELMAHGMLVTDGRA